MSAPDIAENNLENSATSLTGEYVISDTAAVGENDEIRYLAFLVLCEGAITTRIFAPTHLIVSYCSYHKPRK